MKKPPPVTKLFVGVDPGLTGGIAFLDEQGALRGLHAMPTRVIGINKRCVDGAALCEMFRWVKPPAAYEVEKAFIEKVGPRPNQGVSSMFNFGEGAGCVRGVIEALGIATQFVTPQTWKAALGLLHRDKGASRLLAARKWGNGYFARLDAEGMAEAALIALWGAGESKAVQSGKAQPSKTTRGAT